MRNILATIAVLLSVCANAQYSEMLHAYITPTNKVVTSVPDWVKGAADYYTFGFRKDGSLNGFLSFAQGTNVVASGDFSFASGKSTLASAESSHAEGNGTIASGYASHAEGCTTVAKGNCSHAEGRYTTANGTYSHSSGVSSIASNNYSYVWSGVLPPTNPNVQQNKYGSNGEGSFNVNPIGGVNGFYIGNSNLKDIIQKDSGMKFNRITPTTNNQSVVFNPIDGAANYMNGRLELIPIVTSRSFHLSIFVAAFVNDSNEGNVERTDLFGIDFTSDDVDVIIDRKDYDTTILIVKFKVIKQWTVIGEYFNIDVTANNLNSLSFVFDTELSGIGPYYAIECNGFYDVFEIRSSDVENVDIYISGYEEFNFTQNFVELTTAVTIPSSTDTTKERRFSIALETDVNSDKDVIWHGGDIIESFPGASKLVNGYVVWNVNEVAPGKFIVDRSPMNISSSSSDVTIKGDNGNDYTLNIDENGVLEVRNK